MKDEIKKTIFTAEKLAIKIKKKLHRNDLDFNIQISLSSQDPGQIYYALQITPIAEGIAPMTFIKDSPKAFIETLEKRLATLSEPNSQDEIETEYHKSQIKHAERTIKFHKESIEKIHERIEETKEGEDSGSKEEKDS